MTGALELAIGCEQQQFVIVWPAVVVVQCGPNIHMICFSRRVSSSASSSYSYLFPPRFLIIFLLTHPHHHAPPRLSSSYSYSDSGLAGLGSLGSKLQTAEGPATKPVNHTNARSESLILVWLSGHVAIRVSFWIVDCRTEIIAEGPRSTGRQTVACHTSANRVWIGGRRGAKRM